jgi:glycosyltransferase involved in cell wall biosynthesis
MHEVALVGELAAPGGVQSCIASLAAGLNARGIVPTLLWETPPNPRVLGDFSARMEYRPLRVPVPARVLLRLPDSLRHIAAAFNVVTPRAASRSFPVYFSFYNGFLVPPDHPHVYYLSGPPLLPQLNTHSPGLRGLPSRVSKALYKRILSRRFPAYEYHRANQYVINSQYTCRLFHEAHGVELPVVYPPIKLDDLGFERDDLKTRDSITFLSRIVPYKRPELVLELASRFPHYRCVIMGGIGDHRREYLARLRARASNLRVEFLANPPREVILQELRRSRFYVFPGKNEHFGMTTPEAIASGAIPYVHDSGGQREIIDSRLRFSDTDFLSRFAELQSLRESDLHALRSRLADHVRNFSAERFVREMIQLVADRFPSAAPHLAEPSCATAIN